MNVFDQARGYIAAKRAGLEGGQALSRRLQRIRDAGMILTRRDGAWVLMDVMDNRKKWPVQGPETGPDH